MVELLKPLIEKFDGKNWIESSVHANESKERQQIPMFRFLAKLITNGKFLSKRETHTVSGTNLVVTRVHSNQCYVCQILAEESASGTFHTTTFCVYRSFVRLLMCRAPSFFSATCALLKSHNTHCSAFATASNLLPAAIAASGPSSIYTHTPFVSFHSFSVHFISHMFIYFSNDSD